MFTDTLIHKALEEDLGSGDITTDAVVPETLQGIGVILAKEKCVIAGLGVAGGVFAILDPKLKIQQLVNDGDEVKKGQSVLKIQGSYRSLLKGERVALNFLQRLSGIATTTQKYVSQCKRTETKILDTRKTTPLFRHLEKYAVRMGGGENHRLGLFDVMMVKDNHIAACDGSVAKATRLAVKRAKGKSVIVEVTSSNQIEEAIESGANQLLLDNMSNQEISKAVRLNRKRAVIEVSGGITLERVKVLAKLGVDFISVGALTHSPKSMDLSFDIKLA